MNVRRLTIAAALSAVLTAACGGQSGSDTTSVAENCEPTHPNVTTGTSGMLKVSVFVSPPYAMDVDGEMLGVDAETIKEIARMECLRAEMNPIPAAGLIDTITSGRSDTSNGGLYRTDEREEILDLSDTVYTDGMAIVAKEVAYPTLDSLRGKSVGVIQGYLWNDDLQKALGKGNVKLYQSSDGLVSDLKNGRLDAAVLTTAEAAYRIDQYPEAGFVSADFESTPLVGASQAPGEVVFPVKQGNKELLLAINEDIKTLQDNGFLEKVLEKYGLPNSAVVK